MFPSSLSRSHVATLLCLCALGAGCAEEPSNGLERYTGDSSGTWFIDITGTGSITEFDEWGQSAVRLEDGSIELSGVGLVTIEGRGAHEIDALGHIDPLAVSTSRFLSTIDLDTGVERIFHYDAVDNLLVIGDEEGGVFVFANPDNSYDVFISRFDEPDGREEFIHAEDGFEAWRLLSAYNEFNTASPHSVLMGLAMGTGNLVDARSLSICVNPGCPDGVDADAPPLCASFEAVCQCTACWTTGSTDPMCDACATP